MKYLSCLLFAIFICKCSFAQDSTLTLSEFEKFTSQSGAMYRTDEQKVGQVKTVSLTLVQLTNLESAASTKAVQVIQTQTGLFVMPTYGNSIIIDFEELPGVIKALDYFLQQVQTSKPVIDQFYQYITKNDIVVTCSYSQSSMLGWTVSLYKQYHYSKSTQANSVVSVRNKDIDDLIELFKKSQGFAFKQK